MRRLTMTLALVLFTGVGAVAAAEGPMCDPPATWQVLSVNVDPQSGDVWSQSIGCWYPRPLATDCWDWNECKGKIRKMCQNAGCKGAASYSLEQTTQPGGEVTDVCSGSCDGCPVQTAAAAYCSEKKPDRPAPVTGVGDDPDPYRSLAD